MHAEDAAILRVVGGSHPGNCFSSTAILTTYSQAEVDKFYRDIPADWNRFRRVVRWWLRDNDYPPPSEVF